MAVEFTDDPHPRNVIWEMWGLPMFEIADASAGLHEVNSCRAAYPDHYIKVVAYDATLGRQTTALSFIVGRPADEPGFRLDRQEMADRQIRYSLHSYATDRPPGPGLAATGGTAADEHASRIPAARLRDAAAGAWPAGRRPGGQAVTARRAPQSDGPGTPADPAAPPPLPPEAKLELADDQQARLIAGILDDLDRDFIGLAPVKARVREIGALLLVDRLRGRYGLTASRPSLHMCFTGSPGTGKTTLAARMGELLRELGYLRKGQLVSVTRDDLVGQYVGHTAPKTKEVLKRAMGGVLLIDEAYYLYRPDNERDYGQESIEILLQFMEEHRDDLVVILAGYRPRMDVFFQSNPGMASRIGHHIDFPDFAPEELMQIAELMLEREQYQFGPAAREAFREYILLRMQPAALRQRPEHAERHRPAAAAPSAAAGLGRRPDRPGRPRPAQRRGRARQPRVHRALPRRRRLHRSRRGRRSGRSHRPAGPPSPEALAG